VVETEILRAVSTTRGKQMELDCVFCGYIIGRREPHFRSIRGFERLRSRGGANAVALRETLKDDHGNEIYACETCVRIRIAQMEHQEVLEV
jgi:hypothetical protein